MDVPKLSRIFEAGLAGKPARMFGVYFRTGPGQRRSVRINWQQTGNFRDYEPEWISDWALVQAAEQVGDERWQEIYDVPASTSTDAGIFDYQDAVVYDLNVPEAARAFAQQR